MRFFIFILCTILSLVSISTYYGCDARATSKPNAEHIGEVILLNTRPYRMPTKNPKGKMLSEDNTKKIKKLFELCTELEADREKSNFRFGEALFFEIKEKNSKQNRYVGITSNSWFYWNPNDRETMIPLLYSDEDAAKDLHGALFRDLYSGETEEK